MIDDLVIPCDRVTFRDGQRLTSRDLRDVQRRHDRLRRLHHRVLHDTWGIALGFEVTQVDAAGAMVPADGTAVVVGAGYAIDGAGRELLLVESVQPPLPRVPGPGPEIRVLTVRYQDDAAFRDRPDVGAVCVGVGLDRRLERPLFAWRRQEEVRFGEEIPLVQAELAGNTIVGELDPRVRRFTRPASRPYMARGTTEPGRTGWREWNEADRPALGLEVVVDTSAAGFTSVPSYFATLQGASGIDGQPDPSFFLDSFSFIAVTSPDSFTYRLLKEAIPPLLAVPMDPAEAESRGWTVSWFGLEPVRGCEPPFHVDSWFTLGGFPMFANPFFLQGPGGSGNG